MSERDMHFFPTIDFIDKDGKEYRVGEIIHCKTYDGYKKVIYKLHDGKEISFVMK